MRTKDSPRTCGFFDETNNRKKSFNNDGLFRVELLESPFYLSSEQRYLGAPLDRDDAAVRNLQHMHRELSEKGS
jgi:hypothetical protein